MNLTRRSLLRQLPFAALASSFHISSRAQSSSEIWRTGNSVIDQAREVGLKLLNPTQAQIEHAWKLHFDSVIFESYGFAPRFAVDAKRINDLIALGASSDELIDMRESTTMNGGVDHEHEKKEFLDAFHAAGVTCIFQNTGEEGNDPMRLIKRLAHFTRATDYLKPEFSKVVTADEIENLKKNGHVGICFTINGTPLPMNWKSTRDELRYIHIFHELGVKMMHVTYNRRNPLGDGAGEPQDGGLSDFGKLAVQEMNRLGVIADVSHSGWKTAEDTAKASSRPMVASHTTCNGVYEHFRGKPDSAIKAICDTGGLVGICCISRFLGGTGDIQAFLNHLDYLIKKFGPDHAAIGTDISYVSRFSRQENAKIQKRKDGSNVFTGGNSTWEHLWPKDDFITTPQMEQSIAWTNWPLFTLGLIQRGHSDETIRKVLGGNMLRVLRANASPA